MWRSRNVVLEGLGYVWLEVGDLERSVAFYRDGLRFSVVPGETLLDDSAPDEVDGAADEVTPGTTDAAPPGAADGTHVVHLRAGALRLILSPARGPESCRGRGVGLTVEVSGVDAYYDALIGRGLEPSPPRDVGGERSFTIEDPDGFTWRFAQA